MLKREREREREMGLGRQRELEGGRPEEYPLWPLRRSFDSLVEDIFRNFGFPRMGRMEEEIGSLMPRMDMEESEDAFHIMAEMPGIDEKDIDVSVRGNMLTISGEKREERPTEKKGQAMRRECSYGRYQRQIQLPVEVDIERISANYRKGILQVELPKSPEAKEKVKKIEVH